MNENQFDRSKPFYPYVMQYIITYHGVNELFSRGLVNELRKIQSVQGREKILKDLNNADVKEKAKEFISKEPTLTPLLGNLALHSKYMGRAIDVNIDEIANEAISNYDYLLEYIIRAAGMLIITGFDETKRLDNKNDELWNFFYHCRNAAAHGGKFNIKNPRFPAKWGSLEITFSMNGTNLFYIPDKGGLLSVGDPIRLLWEIEQKYL